MRAVLSWVLLGMMVIPLGWFTPAAFAQELNFFDLHNLTEREDGYFSMVNRDDNALVLRTARILHVGTEFIDRDNRRFRVTAIEGDIAWAEQLEEEGPEAAPAGGTLAEASELPVQGDQQQDMDEKDKEKKDKKDNPKVGIYHSHGAESYVPSDGTDSIDQGGGIIDVGGTLAESLEKKGIETEHETETHVPHDAGAYQRSRRTAEKLLTEKDADLLLDVHRDAVPAENYEEEINGEEVTQIMLVVGAENQNFEANMQLARDLKEIADQKYPGLIKGILAAPGSYNQDLSSHAILIEVGAHENSKEEAQKAVELFADTVDEYLSGEAAPVREERSSRTAGSTALMVVVAVLAAVFVYLLIAAGSWAELKRKTAAFFRREFADLRQRVGQRRDDDDNR